MSNKFNIGDSIAFKAGSLQHGKVTDVLFSTKKGAYAYDIELDDGDEYTVTEDEIEAYEAPAEYSYEFDFLEDVVVARFYEIRNGEKKELARGHGHLIHTGAVGVAQAASYALKKVLEKVNGGDVRVDR